MQQLAKVCGSYLLEKAVTDPSIWVLDGDLADSDGAEIFALNHPQFIQAGIAEQNMISMAAGLASTNCRPWVFSFAAFLCYRAYDQIRSCLSQPSLPVTLIGSHAGACTGRNGKSHASLNDIALMATLPHMQIWTPADEKDAKYAIDCISSENLPAYIRCPRDPQPSLNGENAYVKWIGNPSKVALLSYGISTHWAIEVQSELKKKHIDIGVLHFCKLWPLDHMMLQELMEGVETAFIFEDHYPVGGLASFLHLNKVNFQIISLSWPLNWHSQSGMVKELLRHHGLDAVTVAEKIAQFVPIGYCEANSNCKEIFTDHWKYHTWGGVSLSGTGSDLIQTSVIREKLPAILEKYNCKEMMDAPCGDFYWMQTMQLSLSKYVGVDVVKELVESNQSKFGNQIYTFLEADITKEILPKVDIILCRDCLVHLSYEDIVKAIHLFKQSGSTYLLTTTFTNQKSNFDIPTGKWHPLNLTLEPFNFPPPLEIINENCTEEDNKWTDKSLLLWRLKDIPNL